MSRSNYTDDEPYDGAFSMWHGQVASATRGKRGQALLRDMLAALDAMPEKRLIRNELRNENTGEVCALGSVGIKRGVPMSDLDPEDAHQVAAAFDIAPCLAAEVAYVNDEDGRGDDETPEERWARVRAWVVRKLKDPPATSGQADRRSEG